MKLAALLLIGSAMFASAQAQTGGANIAFLPIPDTLPAFLFAPSPLAGTMLRPLIEPDPSSASGPKVMPEPGPAPVAVVSTLPSDAPAAVPAPAATPQSDSAAVAPPAAPAAPAATPTVGKVIVIVENVESNSGTVNVAVCDKDLSREGCPYVRQVPAEAGFVETEFDDIPPGKYAIVGYHDVNGNNEFDKIFGMPREPYALSSRAADELVPTFEDAVLPINAGENNVIIRLKRLGG